MQLLSGFFPVLVFLLLCCLSSTHAGPSNKQIELTLLGTYNGKGDTGSSTSFEISTYHAASRTVFSARADAPTVVCIDVSNTSAPVRSGLINISQYGDSPTSVDVHDNLLVVAVWNENPDENGYALLYNLSLSPPEFIAAFPFPSQPDSIKFSPNGRYIVAALEGEPLPTNCSVNPAGGIGIVTVATSLVRIANFDEILQVPEGMHTIAGATPSIQFEAEYVVVSDDSKTAYASIQESNGIAQVDLVTGKVEKVIPLGFKNYSSIGIDTAFDFDANLRNYSGLYGMYQPDGMTLVKFRGEDYLITANEGDVQDWSSCNEEKRVSELTLDSSAFSTSVKNTSEMGALRVTSREGLQNGSSTVYEKLYSFGGRGISVIKPSTGQMVWESKEEFENLTSTENIYNSNGNNPGTFDQRSRQKGPEPEGIASGRVDGRVYAFIGLERTGGIMVYHVTDPRAPEFQFYKRGEVGQANPEGVLFVKGEDSPSGVPMLVVTHESGHITLYGIGPKSQ